MGKLLEAKLYLFAEGGAGDGATTGAEGQTAQDGQGEIPAMPTRRAKRTGAYDNVIFGKQPDEADAGDSGAADQNSNQDDAKARQEAYKNLFQGEYKDLFQADTQRIIDKRFKETKQLEERMGKAQPVLDLLMTKYGIQGDDYSALQKAIEGDDSQWIEAADAAGMSVDQYRQFNQLQVQNRALMQAQEAERRQQQIEAQVQRWTQEAEALKGRFPQLDLNQEIQIPEFARLLQAGVPVETAYMAVHADDIVSAAMVNTARATEQKVADNIRANRARPAENGASSQSAFVYKNDVTKLTKADRAEAVRRAARGEMISW